MTSQVTRYASVLDTILDTVELDLRLAFEQEHPGATSLEYWARLETPESEARIHELMTLLEKGCHTTNSIRAAVPVIPHLRLNGQEIPYTPITAQAERNARQNRWETNFSIDAKVRLIDTYWREGSSEGHTVNADETSGRGGTSKAPSPLLHFMMGTGFGVGHQTILSAEQLGYRLDQFTIDVETAYDTRGKMMLGNLYTGQLWYKYRIDIQSPESPTRTVELLKEVERKCQTTHTLSRPVRLIPHVIVNQRQIDFTLPDLSPSKALLEERGFEVAETAFAGRFPYQTP